MNSQPTIDFRHTLVAKHPERLSQIRYLLADSGLGLDNDITLFVEAGPARSWWVVPGLPLTSSSAWR